MVGCAVVISLFCCAPWARLIRQSSRLQAHASHLPLDQLELEFGDRLGGIETLRTGLGAVHDRVAAVEPERVLEIVEPLAGGFIAAVFDPAGGLQQRGRSQKSFAVPPIARA